MSKQNQTTLLIDYRDLEATSKQFEKLWELSCDIEHTDYHKHLTEEERDIILKAGELYEQLERQYRSMAQDKAVQLMKLKTKVA